MKYVLTALMAVVALVFLTAPATADYPTDGNWKWIQPPNLGTAPPSWDVNFTYPKVLADDFQCSQPIPITDAHIWFSVKNDRLVYFPTGTQPVPIEPKDAIESVRLSIHSNVPGDPPTIPSKPGDELWSLVTRNFRVAPWGQSPQGWLEPQDPQPTPFPDHFGTWLLNVYFPEKPFPQQGTTARPITYWLDASVTLKPGVEGLLGWKTSRVQWEDDAFWGHLIEPPGALPVRWEGPLVDPITHQSLDLAFIITPEPGTVVMLVGAGLIGLVAYARRRRNS